MILKKAVITAAGKGQGQLPLQTLINRDGEPCSTLSVQHDWDEQADFTKFVNYKVLPPQGSGDQLVERRIMDSVRVHLNERNFVENDMNPDFLIAIHGDVKDRIDVHTYNYGYPYAGYPYWHGGRDVSVTQYQEGTLVIDFVDAADNELVWRGWGTKVLDASTREAHVIQEVVDKILAQFPPN